MTMGNRRMGAIARGLLVVAALALLPLAALVQPPRPVAAQSAGQDSLWAASSYAIGACANPSSPAALAACFGAPSGTQNVQVLSAATDGVNVYFAGWGGGLSCPIAGLASNCTHIMAGSWPPRYNCPLSKNKPCDVNNVNALAAANGQIWLGQTTGEIYRCPANLPYVSQNKSPSQCVLLDDAGDRPVTSLLLANGRLYAGLGCYDSCVENRKQGLLWSCDPTTANACSTLDSYGETTANSLVAGGGYLWAGLDNGIVWKCNLNSQNACDNWANLSASVNSISYDGQATLYAAIGSTKATDRNGSILSCSTSQSSTCGNVLTGINGLSVAAGAGSVFSSSILSFGASPFTAASPMYGPLLYLPAEGPAGVGGVTVKMSAGKPGNQLEKRCQASRNPKAAVTVEGPHGVSKTMKVGACGLAKGGTVTRTFDLLDPGAYMVTVTAGKYRGQASFTIEENATRQVNLNLKRGTTGG